MARDGTDQRGVRSKHYSLQGRFDAESGALRHLALYDHRRDPRETTDVSPAHPEVLASHVAFLDAWFASDTNAAGGLDWGSLDANSCHLPRTARKTVTWAARLARASWVTARASVSSN